MIKIKYRVEEHYNNSNTYMLHGIYDDPQYAVNKIKRLLETTEIKKDNLYIVEITTTTKMYKV